MACLSATATIKAEFHFADAHEYCQLECQQGEWRTYYADELTKDVQFRLHNDTLHLSAGIKLRV